MTPLAESTAPNALNHWDFFRFVQGAMPLNCGLGPVVAMQDLTPISHFGMNLTSNRMESGGDIITNLELKPLPSNYCQITETTKFG